MANRWILGARPRTLPAAIVPVALGAALAVARDAVWWRVALALIVSLALQVGVNYANDYSDGVRGTDEVRVGPTRLTAGGLASAAAVKRAALLAFAVAAVAGLVLAAVTSWWIIAVGVAAILAAWFYTGGANPYGYIGLGEIFVFVFFGLVATVGTVYVLIERIPGSAWWAGSLAGVLACALLAVNNLRDIPTDTLAGKRTLAVRLGDRRARWLYQALMVLPVVFIVLLCVTETWWAALGVLGLVAVGPAIAAVRGGAAGRALIPVLGWTGKAQMAIGLATAVGIAVGRAAAG